jgi:hypothetical protein
MPKTAQVVEERKALNEVNQVLAWLGMVIDVCAIKLGEFPASFDEKSQVETFHCLGCNAEHKSKWPEWKLNFVHSPDCMYLKLIALIEAAQDPNA